MKLLTGFQDTRTNKEDFALTPFLFLVYVNGISKVYGLGICWGYYAVFAAIGFNTPKQFKSFHIKVP